jgi:tetratricopeptide (TPR) repeat protein
MKYRRRLVLLRDDHIGDTLGAIFLDPSPEDTEAVVSRLSDYLGERVCVISAELSNDRIEVEVEVRALADEANRLAAAAGELSRKGVRRNAIALFRQALDLDPLNRDAHQGLGLLLADLNRYTEALSMLKLARVCMQAERTASAIRYLEKGFELDPSHFGIRRALIEMGRKPKLPHRPHSSVLPPVPSKPHLKKS